MDGQARTLVPDLVEDLQTQRYLFERGLKDMEKVVCTLVADLVDGMWAQ